MELISKKISANETSNKKRKKNIEITTNLKNNLKSLKLSERNDINYFAQNVKTTDQKDAAKKSTTKHTLKIDSALRAENAPHNKNLNVDISKYKKVFNKASVDRTVKGQQKDKEKLKKIKKKRKKKEGDGEISEVYEIEREATNVQSQQVYKINNNESMLSSTNVEEKEDIEKHHEELEKLVNIGKELKKDTNQIISELKNILNIVENPKEHNKIDGLKSKEIKILDSWYFANKLKIIPCLFEDKPLSANLLSSLYAVEPSFKNKKNKIIIYLKFVKDKYEKSLKKCSENQTEDKGEFCKNKILHVLDNSTENLKEKEYMKKLITLIKNESSYKNLKHYFSYLLTVLTVDTYDVFLEEDGLVCIKDILQSIAKKKLIKKCIALLRQILNILQKLNITLDHLKNTLIGIPINFISRNKIDKKNKLDYVTDNEQIRNIAKELIDKWKLVRDKALSEKNVDSENKELKINVGENMTNEIDNIEHENIPQNNICNNSDNTEKVKSSSNDMSTNNLNSAEEITIANKTKTIDIDLRNNICDIETNNITVMNKTKSLNLKNVDKGTENVKGSPNTFKLNQNCTKNALKKDNKKKMDKSNESKNIMLEIIDTLNEEYEKKKKRHLEYKKAKIEGKIKKFSALKNTSEISKNDNLLTDIAKIKMVPVNSTLNKSLHMNDFPKQHHHNQHHLNSNFSEIRNLMKNYNINEALKTEASSMTLSASPYEKKNENYDIPNTNIKNRNVNELLKESYTNNSTQRNETNLNRNVQSQKMTKNREQLVDKHVYYNKYNTHDGTNILNNTYTENEIYINNNNNSTSMNYNLNHLKKKRVFSKYPYATSEDDLHDNYWSAHNYKMKTDGIHFSDNMGNEVAEENFSKFSSSGKNGLSEKNSLDNNNFQNATEHTKNDFTFKGTNINQGKTVQFSNDDLSMHSYDTGSYDINSMKENKKLSDDNLIKDPFEYYPINCDDNNNNKNGRNNSNVPINNFKDQNNSSSIRNSSSRTSGKNTSVLGSLENSFMNLLSYNSMPQNERDVKYNNIPNLNEKNKNDVLNLLNKNSFSDTIIRTSQNLNVPDEVNYNYSNKEKNNEYEMFNIASKYNLPNIKHMLNSSLDEIFKIYKSFENIKVNYKIAVKDIYYPERIYNDSEVIKNDIIVKFNYDKLQEKNNVSFIYLIYKNMLNMNEHMNHVSNMINSNNTPNNVPNNASRNVNTITNKEFNMLPLPELFAPANLNELKLPPLPILPNLPPSQNIIPPIIFPYNNNTNKYHEQSLNSIHIVDSTTKHDKSPSNNKPYNSLEEFINIFDEDIQKILLKNTDLVHLLMNKPDVVTKMLKGPQYINEALCSLEEELKNWNKSNLT
ncbi:hypothetical protein MKS88_001847 [Plasmodium brasilianum]|uniref:TFIIS N-terminal domain-containing protein n=2 Tax=Plasmodium (Plasmodium) TaxID=418103 RepID=A0A1A8VST9_PLAMA|nr:hypothetical protein MKS88_001847 [Plasmodium brasilianum]SBS83590.1 hypothetical protein PMALA_007260 [Plasmodium malariae]